MFEFSLSTCANLSAVLCVDAWHPITLAVADSPTDAWLKLLGRVHPLLVHFPIGLVISAAAVEAVRTVRRIPGPSPFALTAVLIGAVVGLVAAFSGWNNAAFEGTEAGPTLFIHRWVGIVTAGLLAVVAYCGWRGRDRLESVEFGFWRVGLMLSALAVAAAGHFGGELAYGDGYIEKAFWSAMRVSTEADESKVTGSEDALAAPTEPASPGAQLFVSAVQPIFEARCYECHGSKKKKGGLNLEKLASATKADEDGIFIIKPGDAEASELVQRIELPRDDEDAMPSEGESLTTEQVAAIRQWINEGAQAPTAPGAVSGGRWEMPQQFLTPEQEAAVGKAVSALIDRGVLALPLAIENQELDVNASLVKPTFTDTDMPGLEGLRPALASLNLARTKVGDRGLQVLKGMPRLARLRLDRTLVSAKCGTLLASLPSLEVLNLCGTAIDDSTLHELGASASLRRLFVWESKVTPEGAAAFRAAHPAIVLITGLE